MFGYKILVCNMCFAFYTQKKINEEMEAMNLKERNEGRT